MSHPFSSRFSSSALPSSSSRSTVQDPNINPRRIVQVLEERVGAVSSDDFPGHRFGKGGGGGGFGEGGEGDQLGNGAGGEGEWDVGGFRRVSYGHQPGKVAESRTLGFISCVLLLTVYVLHL